MDNVTTLSGWGIEPTPGTADEFGRYIAAEDSRWRSLVQRLALRLEQGVEGAGAFRALAERPESVFH